MLKHGTIVYTESLDIGSSLKNRNRSLKICTGGKMMDKNTSKKMAAIAYRALEDKKAENIRVIDIEQVSVIADYFLIASGSNRNQVQALAENVEEQLYKAGYEKKQTEGYTQGNWILLDYGDIVIHIFDHENRLFYDLERIWKDGNDIDAKELEL